MNPTPLLPLLSLAMCLNCGAKPKAGNAPGQTPPATAPSKAGEIRNAAALLPGSWSAESGGTRLALILGNDGRYVLSAVSGDDRKLENGTYSAEAESLIFQPDGAGSATKAAFAVTGTSLSLNLNGSLLQFRRPGKVPAANQPPANPFTGSWTGTAGGMKLLLTFDAAGHYQISLNGKQMKGAYRFDAAHLWTDPDDDTPETKYTYTTTGTGITIKSTGPDGEAMNLIRSEAPQTDGQNPPSQPAAADRNYVGTWIRSEWLGAPGEYEIRHALILGEEGDYLLGPVKAIEANKSESLERGRWQVRDGQLFLGAAADMKHSKIYLEDGKMLLTLPNGKRLLYLRKS